MKCIQYLVLAGSLALGGAGCLASESVAVDINPALTYYRAFLMDPNLGAADRDYLLNPARRNQTLDWRSAELLDRYADVIKLIEQAARSKIPCDWGVDLAAGPGTVLPHLARAKAAVLVFRVHARWLLQNNRPAEAREALLAGLYLGRNVARDGLLISTQVQMANEALLCTSVAENYYLFDVESFRLLVDGFEAGPPRGTIAQCMTQERQVFCTWYRERILSFQKEFPGHDEQVLKNLRQSLLAGGILESEGHANLPDQLIKAAGGTSQGVLKLLDDLAPLFQKAANIASLPYPECQTQGKTFRQELQTHPNPFALKLLDLEKLQPREWFIQARLAMLRAAREYKLHGEAGLREVADPFGKGPFIYQRFVFEGMDRGFELTSSLIRDGRPEKMIFLENSGKPVYVDGVNVGKALPPASGEK